MLLNGCVHVCNFEGFVLSTLLQCHSQTAVTPSLLCLLMVLAGRTKGGKLKGEETAVIDQVAVIGGGKEKGFKQATIKLRFNRNPVIGGLYGCSP
jgi:hypothetical protein